MAFLYLKGNAVWHIAETHAGRSLCGMMLPDAARTDRIRVVFLCRSCVHIVELAARR